MPVMESSAKTVSSAGTAERLVSSSVYVTGATIKAKDGNTGSVYLGGSDVDNTKPPLSSGDSVNLGAPVDGGNSIRFDLRGIWIDSSVNAEGVDFWYQEG